MKIVLTLLIIVLFGINLFSQPFVVSEYLDAGGDPSGEWTEILVIQDMVSIVGYSLRDNAATGSWQPAVKFKDIPLWKNLREGTIIVVNHRNGNIDTDKSDGYIEVGASSGEYFDNPLASDASSLSLNGEHDMIQILDPFGNNVHTLAHMLPTREGDVFAGIAGAKVGTPNSAFRSVHVYHDNQVLNDYNKGLDNNYAITTGSITKGKPNDNSNSTSTNHIFWRTLREPSWANAPNLQSAITFDYKGIKLDWAPASTISDKNEGYLIVRYVDNGNQPINLIDGKIYSPGDKLGPYLIVDTLPDLTSTSYTDLFKNGSFNCGEKYYYRVYIYRYQKSNVDPEVHDISPLNGRGRAYNETDFASSPPEGIVKEIPPVPNLSTLGNRTEFCSNEIAEIISDIKDLNKYYYEWYFDDTNLGVNDFKIIVTKSGIYKLVIKDKLSGCSDSNTVSITFIQAPEAFIINKADSKTFSKDTIIEVCGSEEFNFQGFMNPSTPEYFWLKNGTLTTKTNTIKITESGVYQFVAVSKGLCPDTSFKVDIRYAQPDFDLNPASLSFDFDTAPELDFTIFNKNDKELIIGPDNITINPLTNFTIINPMITNQNPLIIPPKGNKVVKIRFQTTDYNTKNAILSINVCDSIKTIQLQGVRKNSGRSVLQADPITGVNFGKVIYECDEMYRKKINVIVNGPKPLKVILYQLTKNLFTVNSNDLIEDTEVILAENSMHQISVIINNTLPSGTYQDEIIIIYKNDNDANYDTLKIPITAEIINPKFFPDTIKFDFSELPTCMNSFDTTFTLDVDPAYEFEITNNIANTQVSIAETLPKKLRADGKNEIKIKFNFTSTDDIFTFIELIPCGKQIPLEIIPPKRELIISHPDTIDFGIVNNSEFCGDFIKNIIINTSHPVTIEKIEYMNDSYILEIFESQNLKKGDNILQAIYPLQDVGKLFDSVVFVIKECNKKITIYGKGERIDTKLVRLADEIIDFGTNYIGVDDIFRTKIYNFSKTEDLQIGSINVPNPFALFNPLQSEFPKIVKPLDSLDLEFQYIRNISGIHNDSISINLLLPCNRTLKYKISGSAVERKDYKLVYKLPDNYEAFINKNFSLPVELEMSTNFSQDDASIENLKMYFSYDRAIFDIQSTKQIATSLLLQNSIFEPGKFVLDYKLSETDKLVDGPVFEIDIKPLLGHSLKSDIKLDSVIYLAKSEIETPRDSTSISLNGDCFIQFRTVEVGGLSNMILKSSKSINNVVDIDFSIVSDETTKMVMIDIMGNTIKEIVSEQLKPGTYNVRINTENITNGAYYIVLKNGINNEILKINIVK